MDSSYFVRFRGRVTGPFDEQKLKQLAQRGQLSQVHEVSPDGETWAPAKSLDQVFPPRSNRAAAPVTAEGDEGELALDTGSPAERSALPATGGDQATWYYADGGGQAGPIDEASLRSLLAAGTIAPETLVWNAQMPDWRAAETIFDLAEGEVVTSASRHVPGRRTGRQRQLLPLGIAVVLACGGAACAWWLWPRPYVTSANDPKVEDAVMLVLTGVELDPDGKAVFIPLGSGSAFAVTSDGLLCTNRHVVEIEQAVLQGVDALQVPYRKSYRVLCRRKFVEASIALLSNNELCDFACLQIDVDIPLAYFALDRTGPPGKQESVVALGYPGVQHEEYDEKSFKELLASGGQTPLEALFGHYIGALNQTSGNVSNIDSDGGLTWIIHQAAISGGNSGGPLVDEQGCVVGVNTGYKPQSSDGRPTPGNNYAIWSGEFYQMLEKRFPGAVAWR